MSDDNPFGIEPGKNFAPPKVTMPKTNNVPLEGNSSMYAEPPTAPVEKKSKWCSNVNKWSADTLKFRMRALNALNGTLVVILAPFSFFSNLLSFSIDSVLMCAYAVIFGLILCCFECHLKVSDDYIRKRFGFLFSYRGRVGFLFFLGSILIGSGGAVGTTMGTLTWCNALFQGCVMGCHPAFRQGLLDMRGDPTKGYTTGDAEAVAFLKANPNIAKKAASTTMDYAKSNPDLVKSAVSSAAKNDTLRNAAFDAARENPDLLYGRK